MNTEMNIGATLLSLARESIRASFAGSPIPQRPPGPDTLDPPRGAFVTLKHGDVLRGCIGRIESNDPLWQTVATMAREAAFRDPRFAPLPSEELPRVSLEISVLTRPAPVERIEDIVPGRDGLIVCQGARRGLLLPQVAVEWGWDRETFLAHTCTKAGLAPNAWQDQATSILAFSADVFSE